MPLIANLIVEYANTPGTGDVLLLGALPSRRAFSSAYADSDQLFYFLTDEASQQEWGIGTLHLDAPPRITRDTVLGNTAGTTALLNFTAAALIYNEVPAERAIVVALDGATVPMGARRVTGLADGTAATDAVTVEQLGVVAAVAAAAATTTALATETAARAAADTTESTARTSADATEATARMAGDAAEASARAAAITTEATARVAGDAAEASTRAAAISEVQAALLGYAQIGQFPFDGAENGQLELPSPTSAGSVGLIVKWGTANTTTGNNDVITFPTPFPNNCLRVVVCEGQADGWGSGSAAPNPTIHGYTPKDKTGFYARSVELVSGAWSYVGGRTVSYIAIGN